MDRFSTDKLMHNMHALVTGAEGLFNATANQTGARIEKARARLGESLRA